MLFGDMCQVSSSSSSHRWVGIDRRCSAIGDSGDLPLRDLSDRGI